MTIVLLATMDVDRNQLNEGIFFYNVSIYMIVAY